MDEKWIVVEFLGIERGDGTVEEIPFNLNTGDCLVISFDHPVTMHNGDKLKIQLKETVRE